MVNLSKLSENLKELMNERELNQTELAAAMDTCSSKLSSYICGKRAPNYDTFIALIGFFNCSADFLLGLNDYPREDKRYKDVKPFGELLRKILKETGTSQYEFTQKADVSWGIFYNWLAGKSRPSVYNLAKIAAYFGCWVEFWLGRL